MARVLGEVRPLIMAVVVAVSGPALAIEQTPDEAASETAAPVAASDGLVFDFQPLDLLADAPAGPIGRAARAVALKGPAFGAASTWYVGAFRFDATVLASAATDGGAVPLGAALDRGDQSTVGVAFDGGLRLWLGRSILIEPQIQLAAVTVDQPAAADLLGSRSEFDDATSLLGSLGWRASTSFALSDSWVAAPWVEAELTHDFLGDGAAQVNSFGGTTELGRSTLRFGAGVGFAESQDGRFSGFAEAGYSLGSSQDDFRAGIGVRWNW